MLSQSISTPRTELKPLTQDNWDLYRRLSSDPEIIALCFDPPTEADMRQKFESRLPIWTPQSEHWLCLVIYENTVHSQSVSLALYCKMGLLRSDICCCQSFTVNNLVPNLLRV